LIGKKLIRTDGMFIAPNCSRPLGAGTIGLKLFAKEQPAVNSVLNVDGSAKIVIVSPAKGEIQQMNHHETDDKFKVEIPLSEARPDDSDALVMKRLENGGAFHSEEPVDKSVLYSMNSAGMISTSYSSKKHSESGLGSRANLEMVTKTIAARSSRENTHGTNSHPSASSYCTAFDPQQGRTFSDL
jgi:hypothetical protein